MGIRLVNDFVFKYVFGSEGHSKALCGILNATLNLQGNQRIAETTILNPFNLKESQDDKLSILDIKAKDGEGRLFNLEMQLSPQADYVQRVLYYESCLRSTQLKESDHYRDLKPVISISWFDWKLKDNEEVHSIFRIRNIKTNQDMTHLVEYHFIQLPRFNENLNLSDSTAMERWLYLLLKGEQIMQEKNIPKELLEEDGIKEALEAYQRCLADERMRIAILDREKAQRDYNSGLANAELKGIEKGIEKGRVEGQAENMVQLYEKGVINFEICRQGLEDLRPSLSKETYSVYLARLHKKVD